MLEAKYTPNRVKQPLVPQCVPWQWGEGTVKGVARLCERWDHVQLNCITFFA